MGNPTGPDGSVRTNRDEANAIRDSTSWDKPRSTENLPDFLEAFSGEAGKLDQAPKKSGSPHTIIVAGAGLRAADLVRAVRKFQKKGCSVAKLVGKTCNP